METLARFRSITFCPRMAERTHGWTYSNLSVGPLTRAWSAVWRRQLHGKFSWRFAFWRNQLRSEFCWLNPLLYADDYETYRKPFSNWNWLMTRQTAFIALATVLVLGTISESLHAQQGLTNRAGSGTGAATVGGGQGLNDSVQFTTVGENFGNVGTTQGEASTTRVQGSQLANQQGAGGGGRWLCCWPPPTCLRRRPACISVASSSMRPSGSSRCSSAAIPLVCCSRDRACPRFRARFRPVCRRS